MKFLALFAGVLFAAVPFAGCSSGSSEAETPRLKMSAAEIAALPKIEIPARTKPEPHGLVVHDLHKGSGAVMKRGDTMLIDWAEAPYGEALESSPDERQLEFTFGTYIRGWEEGLPGMRVGGRRELVVPTRLGDTGQTMTYVIDLRGIKPG